MAEYVESEESTLLNLCADFFVLGLQIASGNVELPSCEALMRRVMLMFETLRSKAQQSNVLPTDLEDATYALAAYVDEMIQLSSWPGKQQWAQRPLQASLFNDVRAGVNFFSRMQEVRRRSPAALRVYYACLSLGFMGEYRYNAAQEHEQIVDDLRRELFRTVPRELSPHGERPGGGAFGGRSLPLLPLAGICVVLSLGVLVLLYFILSSSQGSAVEVLTRMGRAG
ncbi:MAG: DotU family type IV/VI secretion system protein [Myxococcales bacterium]|nr:DotU family type IV/VI secretion system protein [Myxococcales bacterium]